VQPLNAKAQRTGTVAQRHTATAAGKHSTLGHPGEPLRTRDYTRTMGQPCSRIAKSGVRHTENTMKWVRRPRNSARNSELEGYTQCR